MSVLQSQLKFLDMIKSSFGFDLFLAHLKTEYAEENLLFFQVSCLADWLAACSRYPKGRLTRLLRMWKSSAIDHQKHKQTVFTFVSFDSALIKKSTLPVKCASKWKELCLATPSCPTASSQRSLTWHKRKSSSSWSVIPLRVSRPLVATRTFWPRVSTNRLDLVNV